MTAFQNLKKLELAGQGEMDVSVLEPLKNLQSLKLSFALGLRTSGDGDTQLDEDDAAASSSKTVEDCLGGLVELRSLDLIHSNYDLTTLEFLGKLIYLQHLTLCLNNVHEFKIIHKLECLRSLVLSLWNLPTPSTEIIFESLGYNNNLQELEIVRAVGISPAAIDHLHRNLSSSLRVLKLRWR